MAQVLELSRRDARRIAVAAQLLAKPRPDDLLDAARGVGLLQLEPTSAVAASADLVLWSRLGSSYDVQELRDAADEQRLVELHGFLRPPEDVALFRPEMAAFRAGVDLAEWQQGQHDWVEANNDCRRDVLDRLRADGPLPSSELPDTCVVPWKSSGWNDNRNLRMMLGQLVLRGEVAVAGGRGRDRLWDLADRVYPDAPDLSREEARARLAERRLGFLGISRTRGPASPVEAMDVGEAGEPAVVEGVRGRWRVDAARLGDGFHGRTALLSPFDRLLADRKRMADLFEFDYVLEMYKPAAQRRWGYYALPILHGDRLVGKLDAKAERDEGVLRVLAVHEDEPFSRACTAAVEREIADLARWLDLEVERVG